MAEFLTPKEKVTALRKRIEALKSKLPTNYKMTLATRWPEYDSLKGGTLLNNVLTLRSTDETLTAILETIVSEAEEKEKETADIEKKS